jgi:hypothetical protein
MGSGSGFVHEDAARHGGAVANTALGCESDSSTTECWFGLDFENLVHSSRSQTRRRTLTHVSVRLRLTSSRSRHQSLRIEWCSSNIWGAFFPQLSVAFLVLTIANRRREARHVAVDIGRALPRAVHSISLHRAPTAGHLRNG